MRFLAFAPLVGVSMLLAADVTTQIPNVSQTLQAGALGVLAWVVWYILAKSFPAHAQALKDQRKDFLQALRDERESVKKDKKW